MVMNVRENPLPKAREKVAAGAAAPTFAAIQYLSFYEEFEVFVIQVIVHRINILLPVNLIFPP